MSFAICVLLAAVLLACDQLIKLWALEHLAAAGSIPFISGFLRWTYVENRGAAFGIFQGQRGLLVGLVVVILCGVGYLLWSNRIKQPLDRLSLTLIMAGGAGNLIDRIRLGFVVDYIDIGEWFRYPVFNFADCCVVIGACLLVLSVLIEGRRERREKQAAVPLDAATEPKTGSDAPTGPDAP